MKPGSQEGGGRTSLSWLAAMVLLSIVFALLFFVLEKFLGEAPDAVTEKSSRERASVRHEGTRTQAVPVLFGSRQRPPAPIPVPPEAALAPVAEPPRPLPGTRILPPTPAMPPVGLWGGVPMIGNTMTNYRTAIVGRVLLEGTPPPERVLDVTAPGHCPQPLKTRSFVVGTNSGLADVLVFVRESFTQQSRWRRNDAELTFVDCQIQPFVCGVWQRDWLGARSSDGQMHRLQFFPSAGRTPPGQQIYAGQGTGFLVQFQPELFIPCRCVHHEWETAYVSLMPHPYFAVTSTNGVFVITNIPPGQYTLETRHPAATGTNGVVQRLTVGSDQTTNIQFTLQVPAVRLSADAR